MWENIVHPGRPRMKIRRISFACWVNRATDTNSEYVIVIALPVQQWLHESASILCFTYVACLANLSKSSAPTLSPPNPNLPLNENRDIFYRW